MHQHLILFDHECPFCHKAVKRTIEMDVNKRFVFASFSSQTARGILAGPQRHLNGCNSPILIENYDSTHRSFHTHSQAALRSYWLTGNGWGLVGIFSYLPASVCDFFYRLRGEHRHQFKLKMLPLPGPKERFLP